ncbi:MAG: efflux RND transporter periplasmic adaptor subunit [Methylococcales bacterium]|nr:efflux RND transporter periplasmic adaptor subunit [Methylococcales bacterium]
MYCIHYRLPWLIFSLFVLYAAKLPQALADDSYFVDANPALLKLLKIEEIAPREMAESLRLPARVELDQQRMARIGSSVTGRVTEVDARLGESVKKGARLAMLNSAELGKAQSEYLKAVSQLNLQEMVVQRARRLLQSDVISTATLLQREAVLNEAEVDLQASRDQLLVMGMSEADIARLGKKRNIHSFSPVTASIDGVVIERSITLGEVVQPADNLFTIADLSNLLLVAEVPEQQAQWARTGDRVQAEIPALPEFEIDGELIYVADMVNPETRTVTVRMALSNPQRLLKPQMLATLKISKPSSSMLAIPSQAVVHDNGNDYVFVQTGPSRFEMRQVRLGREESGMRLLRDGLERGERIVTDGAFHLNNERLRSTLE